MSHGSIVISGICGAIPDMVVDQKTGFFVPYQSPHAIAEAVYSLSQQPERYTQMSQSAYDHYQQNFTLEKHLSHMFRF